MKIEDIRKIAKKEEIDYQFLLSMLSKYSQPRDKISEWLKTGDLIRIKKGLYVFGKKVAHEPYSLEILANLIYGPSAISLNYALAHYGFIPEKVTTVTSITNKRNKYFSTPAGDFNYYFLNQLKYPIGIELSEITPQKHFMIASPEKALCDHIHLTDKKIKLNTFDDMNSYLLQDLRIDESALRSIKVKKISTIVEIYQDARLSLLINFLKKWKIKS